MYVRYNCFEMDVRSIGAYFSPSNDEQFIFSVVVMSKSSRTFIEFGLFGPTTMPPYHHVHYAQVASEAVNRAVDYFNLFRVSCVYLGTDCDQTIPRDMCAIERYDCHVPHSPPR